MPSDIQLREIFDALGDGVFVADAQGNYIAANRAGCAMFGYTLDELLTLTLAEMLDPSEWARLPGVLAGYVPGEVTRSEWRFRRADGSVFVGELVGGRLMDGRFQSVVRDISERAEREAREAIVRRESAHRTRNILSLVQAVVRQTASASPETFLDLIDRRIAGLAASFALFADNAWQAVTIEPLVRAQLDPFVPGDAGRVALSGPAVALDTSAAQAIGMAVHELATNAAKYGALSAPGGQVAVAWTVDGERFAMEWRESGGPEVAPPQRIGFGTRMVARMIEGTFGAKTLLEHDPAGVRWRMECALAALGEHAAGSDGESADSAARRVLVLVEGGTPAGPVHGAIEEAGMTVAGTVSTVADLRARMAAGRIDAVVLAEAALGDEAGLVLAELDKGGVRTAVMKPTMRPAQLVSRLAALFEAG